MEHFIDSDIAKPVIVSRRLNQVSVQRVFKLKQHRDVNIPTHLRNSYVTYFVPNLEYNMNKLFEIRRNICVKISSKSGVSTANLPETDPVLLNGKKEEEKIEIKSYVQLQECMTQ
jgi:hypothetical protein